MHKQAARQQSAAGSLGAADRQPAASREAAAVTEGAAGSWEQSIAGNRNLQSHQPLLYQQSSHPKPQSSLQVFDVTDGMIGKKNSIAKEM